MNNIKFYFLLLGLFTTLGLHAQVGINTDGSEPDSSAMLDVQSTDKGMLVPRMTTAQRTAIANPATGLLVFDNETGSFWFYSGSEWTELGGETGWSLTGNAGTDTSVNFIGTTDDMPLDLKVNNSRALRLEYAEFLGAPSPNLIGGSYNNSVASGVWGATIAGGGWQNQSNSVTGNSGTVSGGLGNVAGTGASVSGGDRNTASGSNSVIGGGGRNVASGLSSTVSGGGGFNNENIASGSYSTVPGGAKNTAGGDYSFAAGRRATIDAAHDGTFLFSDQNNPSFNSANSNEFAVRATGGVRFVTAISATGIPTKTISMDATGTVNADYFVGDGSGLTNLPLNGGWSLTGNPGTDTSTNFIGTTDSMPLDFRVNDQRGFRISPARYAPNLIGGHADNHVFNSPGAVISGGGRSGLERNEILNSSFATISGGLDQTISGGGYSTIGGGTGNIATGSSSTISGGTLNTTSGYRSTIGGGAYNVASGDFATVAGGGDYFVGGVPGGNLASGLSSTVPGGSQNAAGGDYSFASGRRATIDAAHDGTFLFSDGNNLDFNSAAANEFAVRATGGVRFVTAIDGSGNPTKNISMDTTGTVNADYFVGDGSGLTNLPLNGGWSLTGNAGTDTTINFIGTTDDMPLDFRVNDQRALRLVPTALNRINLVGGYSGNSVTDGVYASTIAGGGESGYAQSITANYGFIGGGRGNSVSGMFGMVGGGSTNSASGTRSTVAGGGGNTASGLNSTVGGGIENEASGFLTSIVGGSSNVTSGAYSTVAGGFSNIASGEFSTIPGGDQNSAFGDYSFAAGRRAMIDSSHHGSFLFSDYNIVKFTSAAANEFAARATGGVRFVTAIDGSGNPTQTISMDTSGTLTAAAFVGDGSGLTNLPGDNDTTNEIQNLSQVLNTGNDGGGLDLINLGGVTASSYTAASGDGPSLTLYQNTSGGFSAYTWNVVGNESNFFIQDVTGGGKLPFRMAPGAANNRITISGNNVGIGLGTSATSFPAATATLDVGGQIRMRGGATTGYVPVSDSAGVMTWTDPSTLGLGDDLGNHTATQNIQLNGHYLSGDGGDEGVFVASDGKVGIGLNSPEQRLHVAGSAQLRSGGLIFTNNFDGSNLNAFRKSIIDASFNIVGPDTLQKMNFKVSDGTSSGTRNVMTLAGHGNVGIGTSSPTSRLDVAGGNISMNGGWLSYDGDDKGIAIGSNGNVEIGQDTISNDNPVRFRVTADNTWGWAAYIRSTGGANGLAVYGPTDRALFFAASTNGNPIMKVGGDGKVFFGTSVNAGNAKVVINGSFDNTLSYGYLNSSGQTGAAGSPSTNPYSLYANERIAASEFNAHSDERIKNIRGTSDGGEDLATLMQLEVTDYIFRDSMGKGSTPQKKVIAQQVAKVYPQAVSNDLTEVIPDIYQRADVKDGWIELATDLKAGERVKIITENAAEIYEVIDAEAHRFKVSEGSMADGQGSTVFIYGREVNDFHTVDYEAISMLNVSATQELARQVEQLKDENKSLKAANVEMKAVFEKQQAEIDQIKAMLEFNNDLGNGKSTSAFIGEDDSNKK